MKKRILLLVFISVTWLSSFGQCKTAYSELSNLVPTITYYYPHGIWTGEVKMNKAGTNGMPEHIEFNMGNINIESSKGEKNLLSAYGFNKTDHRNYVKMKDWEGYKTEVVESYGRIWVITYHQKLASAQEHDWCEKAFEIVMGRCKGNPSM